MAGIANQNKKAAVLAGLEYYLRRRSLGLIPLFLSTIWRTDISILFKAIWLKPRFR